MCFRIIEQTWKIFPRVSKTVLLGRPGFSSRCLLGPLRNLDDVGAGVAYCGAKQRGWSECCRHVGDEMGLELATVVIFGKDWMEYRQILR